MSYDRQVADRVRRLLAARDDVTEKGMVGGGLSFMVAGNMCCGVTDEALLVRVGPEGRAPALAEPHVRPMELAGRKLRAFVRVDPAGFASEDALASWVQRGLDFVAGLPAKPASSSG